MFERPAVGWAGKARSKACGAGRVRAVHAPSVLRTRCAWRPSRARPHVSGERLHGGRDRPRSSRRSRSSSSTAALGVTNSARVVKDGEACQSRRARREGKRAGRRGRGGQATHPAASPARPSAPSESATACTQSKYNVRDTQKEDVVVYPYSIVQPLCNPKLCNPKAHPTTPTRSYSYFFNKQKGTVEAGRARA